MFYDYSEVEERIDQNLKLEIVIGALDNLTINYFLVIYLYYFRGWSDSEIGNFFGITATHRQRKQAVAKLKNLIGV